MRSRLGALVALAAALPLGLSLGVMPSAQAQSRAPHAARASRGQAVAALHRAERSLAGVKDPAPAADAPARGSVARSVAPAPLGRRDATLALRDLWLERSALTGADRQAAARVLAAPRTAPEVAVGSAARSAQTHYYLDTAHFRLHFTTDPSSSSYTTTSFAHTTGRVLEYVYREEVGRLGYRAPLTDPAPALNHDPRRIDIYLQDLRPAGLYGFCQPVDDTTSVHAAAYCELDNDYANYGTAPIRALRVTAAHEFFHAIQFGYDVGEDRWFMEGSAVWMEDVVYNSINDYLQYVQSPPGHPSLQASPISSPRKSWDHSGDYNVYGDFSVFKFLTGVLGSTSVVREMWQDADAVTHPDVYSLEAMDEVISAHHRSPQALMGLFGAWNTLPPHTYPERRTYLPAHYWRTRTVSRRAGTGALSVNLPHLASAPVRLVPRRDVGRGARLRVVLALPPVAHGAAATVQVRRRDGSVRLRSVPLSPAGRATLVLPFNPRSVESVVVVLTNGSRAMVDCSNARDGRDSCGGRGRYAGRYTLRARLA